MEFENYLSGRELATFLEEMIENTRKWLIIVSPFVRIFGGRIPGYIEKLVARNIEIILIYNSARQDAIKKEDYEWLIKKNVQLKGSRNLHAKCYINEKYALVTSMNLYDYSLSKNFEMGFIHNVAGYIDDNSYVYGKENDSIYMNILEDVLNINCDDSPINFDYEKYTKGYCISTGVKIPFNIDKPMCDEAWEEWCKIGDPMMQQNYCHYSGEKSNGETSVYKPIMRKNYKDAKCDFVFYPEIRDKSQWKWKKRNEGN